MELIIGWISIVISSVFFAKALYKITNGAKSILFISEILFFIIQVVPYAILLIFQLHDDYRYNYPIIYKAVIDEEVNIIYSLLIMFIMGTLHTIAKRAWRRRGAIVTNFTFNVKGRYHELINALLVIGMLSPLVIFIIAPNPSIYFQYSYFYTHSYSALGLEYIFHKVVTQRINYFAFFCMALYYFRKGRSIRRNILTTLSIILMVWFDGKRALLGFSLVSVLLIDWIKKKDKKFYKIFKKAIIFVLIMGTYFLIQGNISGKSVHGAEFINYELYFSRMSAVMTTIYDQLHERTMLDYSGQSILYNLLFFVPRVLWPEKPIMFCKYYTAYAIGVNGLRWNLLVNIWTEFIANFGAIMGPFLVIAFMSFVARVSEKSNKYVYLSGMIFCAFYTFFGFELLTAIIYLIWIGLIIGYKVYELFF